MGTAETATRETPRVVVRCPNWVGDAVMATPALRALRRGLPEAHITLAGTARVREVLEPGPFHDDFLALAGRRRVLADARLLRRGRFDLGLLFTNSFGSALAMRLAGVPRRVGYHRDGRGWLLTVKVPPEREGRRFRPVSALEAYLRLARAVGCPARGKRMELATAPEAEARVEALLAGGGKRAGEGERAGGARGAASGSPPPLAVIAPGGAFGSAKLWPAERFAALADHLARRHGMRVAVSAAPAEQPVVRAVVEKMRHPAIPLAGAGCSLQVLKALVRRSCLVVTNDSGPRHVAAAFDRPVVTIFGPTDPRWSETGHPKEVFLLPECDCAPCQRRACPTDHRCMRGITVERVAAACDELLERFPPQRERNEA